MFEMSGISPPSSNIIIEVNRERDAVETTVAIYGSSCHSCLVHTSCAKDIT